MNLKIANDKMIQLMEELASTIPQLEKLETQYYGKYYDMLLHSQERTEGQREASCKLQLAQLPIATEYLDLKYRVRVLLTTKDLLTEVCRNFRQLERTPIDKEEHTW